MSATLMRGKPVAERIRAEVAEDNAESADGGSEGEKA